MTRAKSTPKLSVPASLLVLAAAFVTGMLLALYGYAQDRAFPLYVGLGLCIVGGFFGVLRISVWGDNG